jgi:hypothetical protein
MSGKRDPVAVGEDRAGWPLCGAAPVPGDGVRAGRAYDARTSAKTSPIGGQPLRDTELLAWGGEIIQPVLADLA